jgi:hypothetical protein
MQLSDRHTMPTPALPPTCSVALYKALPSPEPATESLTPPVLGTFMGETLDPANASYANVMFDDPRPNRTVAIRANLIPVPLVVLMCMFVSEVHTVNMLDVRTEACIE